MIGCNLKRLVVGAGAVVMLLAGDLCSAGKIEVLHEFAIVGDKEVEGNAFTGPLVMNSKGVVFGNALTGGDCNLGTVFTYNTASREFTRIISYDFKMNGARPHGGLSIDANDRIYGATSLGGQSQFGRIFQLQGQHAVPTTILNGTGAYGYFSSTPVMQNRMVYEIAILSHDGPVLITTFGTQNIAPRKVYKFDKDDVPVDPLLPDTAGNIYGLTPMGGVNHTGMIYCVDVNGKMTTVVSAPAGEDHFQGGLARDAAGNFYGVMRNNSIFKVDAATHALTQIASFPGNHSVQLALSTGPRGTIYGSTEHEIFKIDGTTHKVSQLARIEDLAPKEQSATFSTIYLLSDGNLYGLAGLRLFRVTPALDIAKTTEDARPADNREAVAQAIAK